MNVRQKHVPVRTCIGCRTAQPKRAMLRIVRTPDGEVLPDPTGKKSGRGAYICYSKQCLEAALAGRRLERALGCTIDQTAILEMEKLVSDQTL
ncbi:MAG TPA: YlxR family protein [Firmicutes bacterium]|jgi:predicted RNA-binding protein YlxR (DUF448 family)|nr:YlxR family protein [Bacillota bacterium]